MRYRLLFIFLVVSSVCNAQKSFQLNGYFKENYRVLKLGKQAQRLLFIKSKGNIILPEWGYYLNLIESDAKRLGEKDVLIIADGSDNFVQSDTKLQTIYALPLSNLEKDVYYPMTEREQPEDKFAKKLQNPKLTDTIPWSEVTNYNNLKHIKEWINLYDSKDSVIVQNVMFATLTSGECITSLVFDRTAIKELASRALSNVANLFDLINDERWTKKDWINWYATTMDYKEPYPFNCNARIYSIPAIYKYGQGNTQLFGQDSLRKRIIGLERLTYNVDDYKGNQILQWDSLQYYKSDYYKDNQEQVFKVQAFKSIGADLYMVGKYNTWSQFKFDQQTSGYVFQKQLKLMLPEHLNLKGELVIELAQMETDRTYIVVKIAESKIFYAITLDTRTGTLLHFKSLKEVIPMLDVNKVHFTYIKYGSANFNSFLFGFNQNGKFYLVKANADFSDVKTSDASKTSQNSTIFLTANSVDLVKVADGNFIKTGYDLDFSNKISKTTITEFSETYGAVTFDGKNYRLFLPFTESLSSGIRMITLDEANKMINKRCVYSFVQIEEPMEENIIHLKFASNLGNDFYVFFKRDSSLHYAKVKEVGN